MAEKQKQSQKPVKDYQTLPDTNERHYQALPDTGKCDKYPTSSCVTMSLHSFNYRKNLSKTSLENTDFIHECDLIKFILF